MTQLPNNDLCVLIVKTDDPDNLHCHKQELTLVVRTLAQEVIIVSKNSKIFIEIKTFSLFFFPFWKKQLKSFWIFLSPLSSMSHWGAWLSFAAYFSNSAKVLWKFWFGYLIILINLSWNCYNHVQNIWDKIEIFLTFPKSLRS